MSPAGDSKEPECDDGKRLQDVHSEWELSRVGNGQLLPFHVTSQGLRTRGLLKHTHESGFWISAFSFQTPNNTTPEFRI